MPKSRRVISILCVISICVSTFLFSFSSSASTEAGTYSKTFTVNQTLDDFGLSFSNVTKPFETVEVDQEQYTYFYRQFGGQNVFTTHQDVFAYKVKVEPISCTVYGDQIDYCRLVLGTQDELSRGGMNMIVDESTGEVIFDCSGVLKENLLQSQSIRQTLIFPKDIDKNSSFSYN